MYCIGLMSGTSVDGIDACLVEITGSGFDLKVELLNGETYAYPQNLRKEIIEVSGGAVLSFPELADLDDAIAAQFALAAQKIQKGMPIANVIGSHGQTVFHRPPDHSIPRKLGYSWQLGRGEMITHLTGIPTVSNFRVADVAAGGQGAPLVSKIDACLLSHPLEHRCIQNLGGIGNVTYLPPKKQRNWEDNICGWDTGPGNVLIDLAVQKFTKGQQTYDLSGQWASQGKPCQQLINHWLQQSFFKHVPPKSTGRELFGEMYLSNCWTEAQSYELNEADFLATLTELTVLSIIDSYQRFLPVFPDTILLCGGGSHNLYLRERLKVNLASATILLTTDDVGLNGDFKEAIAFAVLAYWRFYDNFAGNLPKVTGAKQPQLLGEIHHPILS